MPSERLLRDPGRQAARPLGFRTSNEPPPPSILIATRGPVEGNDVCVFSEPPAEKVTAARPLCGLEVEQLTAEAAEAAKSAGLAFVSFRPEQARGDALANAEIDLVLRLSEEHMEPEEARMLAALRPVLVVFPQPELPLSLSGLLRIRRSAAILDAPFAVSVPLDIAVGDLQALRDAGLAVVVLDPAKPGDIVALRERIAALPAPAPRRRSAKLQAALPRTLPQSEDFEDRMG